MFCGKKRWQNQRWGTGNDRFLNLGTEKYLESLNIDNGKTVPNTMHHQFRADFLSKKLIVKYLYSL